MGLDRPSPHAWPPVEHETLTWTPRAAGSVGPAAARLQPVATYAAAVPPRIAELPLSLDGTLASYAAEAVAEMARLDAQLGARVASFAPVLLRSEAASSSRIEHLSASARSIFTAELGGGRSRNADDVVANTAAMRAALDLAGDVSARAVLRMHAALMAQHPHHTPGAWRTEPVWIGTSSASPVGADFVAPDAARVPGLVDDLVAFCRRVDLPALPQVAIAHAQFETIHPFTDGNGRTGRALAQSLLRFRAVTRSVAVPVSAGLLTNLDGYVAALTAYRAGDPAPIVRAFADAAVVAVENTRQLVGDLDAVRAGWQERLTARRDSHAWRLLDVFTRRPVLTAEAAAGELGVGATNIYPALRTLRDTGILQFTREHGTGTLWRSDEILHAIDAFAQRAGRRA